MLKPTKEQLMDYTWWYKNVVSGFDYAYLPSDEDSEKCISMGVVFTKSPVNTRTLLCKRPDFALTVGTHCEVRCGDSSPWYEAVILPNDYVAYYIAEYWEVTKISAALEFRPLPPTPKEKFFEAGKALLPEASEEQLQGLWDIAQEDKSA